jgi:hypothetical protein
MVLNVAFGASLTYTMGPGVETQGAWSKALRLAQELCDVEYILRALRGLWSYHMNRGEHRAALTLANQFCAVAEHQSDARTLRAGHRMAGLILHYLGDQEEARRRTECAMDPTRSPSQPLPMTRFILNESVAIQALLARISWLQGFPVQAIREANHAVRQAQASGHVLSQCHALAQAACPIALWTGDLAVMDHFVTMLIELASLNALDGWIARGRCFRGVVLIVRGQLDEGVDILRSALGDLRVRGSMAEYPAFRGALALGLALAGDLQEGLGMIDEALRHSENTEESWSFAELLRVKGQILQLGNVPDAAASEEAIRRALEVSRRQGALSLELRSATALTRLRWQVSGRDRIHVREERRLWSTCTASSPKALRPSICWQRKNSWKDCPDENPSPHSPGGTRRRSVDSSGVRRAHADYDLAFHGVVHCAIGLGAANLVETLQQGEGKGGMVEEMHDYLLALGRALMSGPFVWG